MSPKAALTPALALFALTLAAPATAHAVVAGPTFAAPKVLGVGVGVSDPRSLVVADLDEDGRPDLVAGDRNGDIGRVTVLRSTGPGTFGAPVGGPFDPGVLGAGVGPVAAGDFNGDGRPDVIAGLATGAVNNEVLVMDGDGTGRLAPDPSGPVTTRASVTGVAVADLDTDGDLDAITSHEVGSTASQMAVLRQGGGAMTFVSSYGPGTTSMAMDVAVGQLDGLSGPDALVVSRNAGAGSAWVAVGTGATFAPQMAVPVGPSPTAVRLADLDGDGDLDGLVLDGSTGLLTVLTNDGDGVMTGSSVIIPGLGDGSGLAVGDLDGDGNPDAVVTDQVADRAGVLLGDGHGGFGPVTWQTMGAGTRSPVIADLTGDGVPDIATADSGADALSLRRNTSVPDPQATGPGAFGTRTIATTGAPQTVTIRNAGHAVLNVQSVSTAGSGADDFLLTQDGCTGDAVLSGGTDGCEIHVRFAPSAAGARAAVLRLRYAGGGTYDVPLAGTGALPEVPAVITAPAAADPVDPVDDPVPAAVDAPKAATPAPRPTAALRVPLTLTLDHSVLKAASGAVLKVGFTLGRKAKLVLRVKRGAKTVEILRATGKAGDGTITWDGRLGARPAPAGTYRLAAYAVTADGVSARASATLTIRRT
jgi:hypothetical protein